MLALFNRRKQFKMFGAKKLREIFISHIQPFKNGPESTFFYITHHSRREQAGRHIGGLPKYKALLTKFGCEVASLVDLFGSTSRSETGLISFIAKNCKDCGEL